MHMIARIAANASHKADDEFTLIWLATFIWLDPVVIVDLTA